jgi:NitT/TauT family transport system substrate-binding protein
MAYPPIVASLPMFIAEDKKLFEREKLELKKTQFANSNDMMNALVADQVDLLPAVSLIPIIHLEIQYPGRVRLFSHSRMRPTNAFDSLIVKENSPIKNLTDLENKKVGIFPGTSATNMLNAFLKKKGVNTQQISFIQLAPPAQLSSLESGAIDALFTYEPVTTIATKKGGYRSLFGSVYADLLNPCPIGASVISRNFERKNPETAAKAIKIIDEGVLFMRERPDESKKLLSRFTEMSPEISSSINVVDVTLSHENDVANLQQFIDLLYEVGEIKEKIDARRLLDPTR